LEDNSHERGRSGADHIVLLVHGIRDYALWQTTIRSTLEQEGLKVEATNYGRVGLVQFLLPIPYFRKRAIESVWRQVRIVKQNNESARISVIAHSFGTYVIAHLMQEEFDIKFYRVVLCGSVVRYNFAFEQFQERFSRPIINEVGTRDVWPALAESVTIGYGSAGTYGFRRPLVLDRWHNGAHHGYFLNANFCKQFWLPFLRDGVVVDGAEEPEAPRTWVRSISLLKVKYVLVAVLAGLFCLNLPTMSGRLFNFLYATHVVIPNPSQGMSPEDLDSALKRIEGQKSAMNSAKKAEVSKQLTDILMKNDSVVARGERRTMNGYIVRTLLSLNDNDLSIVWRNLPKNLDLAYVDFSGANLSGVHFEDSFLIYADFSNAQLDDAVFTRGRLRNVDFSDASISQITFSQSDWYNALNLPLGAQKGTPVSYSRWMVCPDGYRNSDLQAFKSSFRYPIHFNAVEEEARSNLIKSWTAYSSPGGLCDLVAAAHRR